MSSQYLGQMSVPNQAKDIRCHDLIVDGSLTVAGVEIPQTTLKGSLTVVNAKYQAPVGTDVGDAICSWIQTPIPNSTPQAYFNTLCISDSPITVPPATSLLTLVFDSVLPTSQIPAYDTGFYGSVDLAVPIRQDGLFSQTGVFELHSSAPLSGVHTVNALATSFISV